MSPYKPITGKKDGRRRHSHFQVTITYFDRQVFGRVYTDLGKAERFAARQKRSPVVKSTKVRQVG
jgi:hypothetical protein